MNYSMPAWLRVAIASAGIGRYRQQTIDIRRIAVAPRSSASLLFLTQI